MESDEGSAGEGSAYGDPADAVVAVDPALLPSHGGRAACRGCATKAQDTSGLGAQDHVLKQLVHVMTKGGTWTEIRRLRSTEAHEPDALLLRTAGC